MKPTGGRRAPRPPTSPASVPWRPGSSLLATKRRARLSAGQRGFIHGGGLRSDALDVRVEEDQLLRHLGQPVENEDRVLQVVEEAEEEDVVEPLVGRQTVRVNVLAHDLGVDAELFEDERRLVDELDDGLDHDASSGASLLHAEAEVTGIAADVEDALALQVVGQVRLDQLPALDRIVRRRLAVAGPDPARELEVVVPPAELLNAPLDVLCGLTGFAAPRHGA